MRRKTYLIGQNAENVADVLKFRCMLAVILSAVALPIVPKVEFNFEVILYIAISVFLSPGSCFKSAIRYQNSISKRMHRSSCYSRLLKEGKILHQKGLRGLCTA